MLKISALITTYNEERHIRRCLASLDWVDEILVIDSNSHDQTTQICQNPQAPWAGKLRLISEAFQGLKQRRKRLLQEAAHDWVLVIDADEACSPELAQKIREFLSLPNGPPKKAYRVRRREYFMGRAIRGGMLRGHFHERFFNRQGVYYVSDLSTYPIFPSTPGRLYEHLEHSPDFNPDAFIRKMNRLTTLDALQRVEAGMRSEAFHMVFSWPYYFCKMYFIYGAYRDGLRGFILSVLEGFAQLVRYIKVWQYRQEYLQSEEKRLLIESTDLQKRGGSE